MHVLPLLRSVIISSNISWIFSPVWLSYIGLTNGVNLSRTKDWEIRNINLQFVIRSFGFPLTWISWSVILFMWPFRTFLSQICRGFDPMLYKILRNPLWKVFLNISVASVCPRNFLVFWIKWNFSVNIAAIFFRNRKGRRLLMMNWILCASECGEWMGRRVLLNQNVVLIPK